MSTFFSMLRNLTYLMLGFLFFISCNEGSSNGQNQKDQFERKSILENFSNNIIIPRYTELKGKVEIMDQAIKAFVGQPTQETLIDAQSAWLDAHKSWQKAEMFNIGPAEEINLHFLVNVYPSDTTDIWDNALNQDYDLSHPNNHDAQGLPALDYLLNGVGNTEVEIVEIYSQGENASELGFYLLALSQNISTQVNYVLDTWINSYKTTFENSDGNSATSSINKLINDFIYYYEKGFRANKIGIPAGVFSQPLPDRVELYYAPEHCKTLLQEAFNAIQETYVGISEVNGDQGVGFDDYLKYLEERDIAFGLNDDILEGFALAQDAIDVLDDNFVLMVESDQERVKMLEAYDAIQSVVRLLKVDMVQAMNIIVDYQDADGD